MTTKTTIDKRIEKLEKLTGLIADYDDTIIFLWHYGATSQDDIDKVNELAYLPILKIEQEYKRRTGRPVIRFASYENGKASLMTANGVKLDYEQAIKEPKTEHRIKVTKETEIK